MAVTFTELLAKYKSEDENEIISASEGVSASVSVSASANACVNASEVASASKREEQYNANMHLITLRIKYNELQQQIILLIQKQSTLVKLIGLELRDISEQLLKGDAVQALEKNCKLYEAKLAEVNKKLEPLKEARLKLEPELFYLEEVQRLANPSKPRRRIIKSTNGNGCISSSGTAAANAAATGNGATSSATVIFTATTMLTISTSTSTSATAATTATVTANGTPKPPSPVIPPLPLATLMDGQINSTTTVHTPNGTNGTHASGADLVIFNRAALQSPTRLDGQAAEDAKKLTEAHITSLNNATVTNTDTNTNNKKL